MTRRAGGTPLTLRQLQMLRLLAEGLTAKQIAALLHLQPSSVRSHLTAARRNLGAATSEQAVAILEANGWLSLDLARLTPDQLPEEVRAYAAGFESATATSTGSPPPASASSSTPTRPSSTAFGSAVSPSAQRDCPTSCTA